MTCYPCLQDSLLPLTHGPPLWAQNWLVPYRSCWPRISCGFALNWCWWREIKDAEKFAKGFMLGCRPWGQLNPVRSERKKNALHMQNKCGPIIYAIHCLYTMLRVKNVVGRFWNRLTRNFRCKRVCVTSQTLKETRPENLVAPSP